MYNFKCNYQSSPKSKFKNKLKFNDISDSVQSSAEDFEFYNYTDYNDEGLFKDNAFDYDLSNIKSEIDIEDHELPVIKQELETDSSSSSPRRKKQKHKVILDIVKTEQNQHLSNGESGVKLKKSRTHPESDIHTENHENHKPEKKKRKKHKNLLALNDEDTHSLETETDSSLSSEKSKKREAKELFLNSETDSALDSSLSKKVKKKKNKKKTDSLDETNRVHQKETNDDEKLETEMNSSLSPTKSDKKKREASGDNIENNFERQLSEDNVEHSKKKKKKNRKKKKEKDGENEIDIEMNHDNDDIELETNSLNINEIDTDLHPEKAKKKKKKHKEKKQENVDNNQSNPNIDQDQDNGIETDTKTTSPTASNSNLETLDDNNEIELETNSLNSNKIDTDLHPEKAKKKKKKHKEKKQENVDSNQSNSDIDQDQDNGIDADIKTTSPTDDINEIQLETNSLNSNEIDTDLHPEKAKKKKKKHKEQERNVDNNQSNSDIGQDQDHGIETESQTTSPTASNSNIETQDNNEDDDDDDKRKNHETSLDKNCFQMNSSSDDDSDVAYKILQEQERTKKLNGVLDNKKKINKPKNKINIISNRLINKSPTKERSLVRYRKKSVFAQRYEGYSSNDEPDNRLKPKVDHNTTLEDVLERSKENDEKYYDSIVEQFGEINVTIPFEVPLLHQIEISGIRPINDENKEEIHKLGLQLKKGAFSKQEDDTILANWKDFCKMHGLPEDPGPFVELNILKELMTSENRLNFIRFLARNLNDRILYSVYGRFRRLMERKTKRFGKFTAEEDRIILDYLGQTTDKYPFKTLAKILNRDSGLIHKRMKSLQNNTETHDHIVWDKEMLEDVVKNLLKVTKTEDIAIFEKRKIALKEWEKVGKIMNIPPTKLRYAWHHRIYRELFFAYDEVSTAHVRTKLIKKLYEMNVTDFRTINWHELVEDFDGLSAANLCKYFHNMLQYHVPRNYHDDAKGCLDYLHNQLLSTFVFAEKKFQKAYLNV